MIADRHTPQDYGPPGDPDVVSDNDRGDLGRSALVDLVETCVLNNDLIA